MESINSDGIEHLTIFDIKRIVRTAVDHADQIERLRTALEAGDHDRVLAIAREICGLRPLPGLIFRASQKLTLNPKEVAEVTGLGITQVYRLFKSGDLPNIAEGKRFRVPKAALERWLASRG